MDAIDPNAKLSLDNIKVVMESTLKFEYLKTDEEKDSIVFWNNEGESPITLSYKAEWTLVTIMDWITTYYSREFKEEGKEVALREIRKAIGICN